MFTTSSENNSSTLKLHRDNRVHPAGSVRFFFDTSGVSFLFVFLEQGTSCELLVCSPERGGVPLAHPQLGRTPEMVLDHSVIALSSV